MLAIILAAGGLMAGVMALVLASDGFAYEVSRVVEAAFERIELRLDRRSQARHAAARAAAAADQSVAGQVVVLKTGAGAPYARAGVTGPLHRAA